MEFKAVEIVNDKSKSERTGRDIPEAVPAPPTIIVPGKQDCSERGEKIVEGTTSGVDTFGEVKMEVSITSDDVIRAGGFGARDEIGSFLPVASDSTDFEAAIRDARDYEEPQGETCRPGLGWKEATKSE